jgi:SpoVK/Ycf46/Vps4 family AAA+-type ATPase
LFFVDLPGRNERKDTISIHIKKRKQSVEGIDLDMLADATQGYSGSEIEAAVKDAMHMAWATPDHRLTTALLLAEVRKTIPLSESMNEQIDGIKKMASRMRFASNESLNANLNRRGKKVAAAKPGTPTENLIDEPGVD